MRPLLIRGGRVIDPSRRTDGVADVYIVGRTIEAHSRYDLLFPSSHRVELNVPEEDLEPIFKEGEGFKRHS